MTAAGVAGAVSSVLGADSAGPSFDLFSIVPFSFAVLPPAPLPTLAAKPSLAASQAAWMAQSAVEASSSGGSPTAFELRIPRPCFAERERKIEREREREKREGSEEA